MWKVYIIEYVHAKEVEIEHLIGVVETREQGHALIFERESEFPDMICAAIRRV